MSVPDQEMKQEVPKGKGQKAKGKKIGQAAARPVTTVYDLNGNATKTLLPIPDVCLAPIRADIVNFVFSNMAKNSRQPYGVKVGWGPKGIVAGMQNAAASWGTGRAVSRIPRVRGGGTHRAGQGAWGNMCRGGRMFAPTKVWRRWHRKINLNQKRYAVCSALSASCVPGLVMARGHRIQSVNEIPLVIEDSIESIKKTKGVVNTLRHLKLSSELGRCKRRYQRAGKGKMRNRRFRRRTGPLIIYNKNDGIVEAARNIPGVDLCNINRLNLLLLAPGSHVGRFIIWTRSAFEMLPLLYGSLSKKSALKKNYIMPKPIMMNSDLDRIINSAEIQSVIKPKKVQETFEKKRNPLKRAELYAKLNPLFEQEMNELKKEYKDDAKIKTFKLLKPVKKKQRIKLKLSKEERDKMRGYYQMVMGKSPFKSRKLLDAEKAAVQKAIEKARLEKAGKEEEETKHDSGDDSE